MTTPKKKKAAKKPPVQKPVVDELIDTLDSDWDNQIPEGLLGISPGAAIPSPLVETNVTIYVNTKTGMFWIEKIITSNRYNDSPENHICKIGREGFIHENVYYPPH